MVYTIQGDSVVTMAKKEFHRPSYNVWYSGTVYWYVVVLFGGRRPTIGGGVRFARGARFGETTNAFPTNSP